MSASRVRAMIRVHPTRPGARHALAQAGYGCAHSSPGRPELWVKGRERRAVLRRVVGADETWEVVAYPEPAVCRPDELAALTARDGAVLSAGVLLPEPAIV